MGLKPAIMAHSPARIYETAFWVTPSKGRGIVRTGTSPSCPDVLQARYPFTTLLHQGRIENVFISDIEKRGYRVQRPWTISGFESSSHDVKYPIAVRLAHIDGTASEVVRTKYLFSGEGSRSLIRKQLDINIRYKEPPTDVWSVIDGRVRTDFPDIKMSCSIHSEHGSVMVIPRENDMVRFYAQLPAARHGSTKSKQAYTEETQQLLKKALAPFFIEWEHVEWSSTYRVRQGIADRYGVDRRIFLGGDACHTHSPKAGQGMNTAFLDSQNLAWKIHMVERGFAHRDILDTYEHERRRVANALIEFDNHYAKLYANGPQWSTARPSAAAHESLKSESDFSKAYVESRAFVSGYGIRYGKNILNWSPDHPATSPHFQVSRGTLAPGGLFVTADVTRVEDANLVYLEQAVPLNGSFRIMVFAGQPSRASSALRDLSQNLGNGNSFYTTSQRPDIESVSWHEKHNPHSLLFTFCVVFAAKRSEIDIDEHVPGLLSRYRHHVYADDRHCGANPTNQLAAAHAKVGCDAQRGLVVVVRPDGYVGAMVRLVEGSGTADALQQFFTAISAGTKLPSS
ncbi:elongation factor 3 [Purpureocillium lavendulum]|uniref:Elongation factor 3 n=1 Tax=Purpureocillium lavendulum TaxID=1247861 RepID=A0AB34FY14_9HYPO|nr:elongation factor 3 [Purpureocillium lavendulum]